MDTTGGTILITGATSGIGLGLARRWRAAGSTVIVAGRRQEKLDEIAAEHPGIHTVALDVTDPASIVRARDAVLRDHPDLDAVVTMAGIMQPEDWRGGSSALETAEQVITTNVLGTWRTVDAFLPHLLTRPAATLMTVSSGLAFVPLPLTATYCATKAAVHSFTQSLRAQLAGSSVQVVELVPPAVATDLMGQAQAGRGMPLEDYLTEVTGILAEQPDVEEVLVEAVQRLRYAEARGTHAERLAEMAARS